MTRQQMSLYESLCPWVTMSFLWKYFTNVDGNMTVFVRVCNRAGMEFTGQARLKLVVTALTYSSGLILAHIVSG